MARYVGGLLLLPVVVALLAFVLVAYTLAALTGQVEFSE